MRLADKSVLITGATGSIGKETAKLFKKNGAKLALLGRDKKKLDELQAELGVDRNIIYLEYEARDESSVASAINKTNEKFGSLDAVIAYAATEGAIKPLTDHTYEQFNSVLEINVTGVWLYMKHAIPIMKEQGSGSIIAVASAAGLVGFNGLCPYSASKHAVCGLVKTACIENGPFGIRVNALAPGPIDNRMMASLGEQLNPEDPQSVRDIVTDLNPMNRYGTNEEIANLALFLGSDESSYCNGSVYLADGGFTAG